MNLEHEHQDAYNETFFLRFIFPYNCHIEKYVIQM
jgi:hypothetical protein